MVENHICLLFASATGEISSDLYRDQFLIIFLNFSFLMLILMFFFHFWVVVDGKIHCQAQQRFFLNLYLILTCLMSPHDNWHFPIIMWKGGLEWKKSLNFNKILTTDYKKSIFLKMCPKFDGLEAFSWFVPFFENLRHHVGTPTRWCP